MNEQRKAWKMTALGRQIVGETEKCLCGRIGYQVTNTWLARVRYLRAHSQFPQIGLNFITINLEICTRGRDIIVGADPCSKVLILSNKHHQSGDSNE